MGCGSIWGADISAPRDCSPAIQMASFVLDEVRIDTVCDYLLRFGPTAGVSELMQRLGAAW